MFSDRDIAVITLFTLVAVAVTAIGEVSTITETQDNTLTVIAILSALMVAYRLGKGSS